MEDYVAADERPLDLCRADISASDFYVGIFAWRYGFIPQKDNDQRLGITELEFRYASKLGKPCLIFLLREEALWPKTYIEREPGAGMIERLREELKAEKTVSFFSDSQELSALVGTAVHHALGALAGNTQSRLFQNLPRQFYEFVGREEEILEVQKLLAPSSKHFLITIDGIAGIGKTALALEVGYRYLRDAADPARNLFEAIIWVSAKEVQLEASRIVKKHPAARTVTDLFRMISLTLDREDIIRSDLETQFILVRAALTKRRTLLIIDNLETVSDDLVLDFLRDLPAPTKALITTRSRIDGAVSRRLSAMADCDARRILSEECAKHNVGLTATDVDQLCKKTGRVPLALVWSVSLLAEGYTTDAMFEKVDSPDSEIAKYCFETVLRDFRGRSAYYLLLVLAMFPVDADRKVLGELCGLQNRLMERDEGLVRLESLSIVNRTGDRFSMLPLARRFAIAELNRSEEGGRLRQRWREWIITKARALCPRYWYEFDLGLVRQEIGNLEGVIDWAAAQNDGPLFLAAAPTVCWYFNYVGMWNELVNTAEDAVRVAKQEGDLSAEAQLRSSLLGFAYSQQHKFDKAIEHVQAALAIYRDRLQDRIGYALALSNFAQVLRKQNRTAEAEEYYHNSANQLRDTDDDRTYIAVQFELGKLARDKENWPDASRLFFSVLEWLEAHPDDILNQSQLKGAALGHLALVEYYQSDYQTARDHCIESLKLFSESGLKVAFGSLYWRLAMIEQALGNAPAALQAAEMAIEWFDRLGMHVDRQRALNLKADLLK